MFEHLKKMEIADATSKLSLAELGPDARLELRYAGESNPAYYNAMLKRVGKRAKRQASRTMDTVTAADMELLRTDDRELYPATVLVGWEGVLSSKREPVPFSVEAATALCQQLPAWLFDLVREHARQIGNFVDQTPPDADELVGN